ncbi:aminotransferase class V-fold PLP-dependent enzyme [Aureispira anguillae]|uniref:Aminotransferase class V-fold PLP-dependent enzyme n=1 Tax=Aureispira anguillae TaxID=2864201 RepID=A0A915VKG0_9BACT|nr:aminotransferase class V-fold PLP-dependent enzyme [Aureispira anguillae]BDS09649.1 aminotransferase class V-fold PLP-dependent enzyme [Aureispira anguillae]
MIAGSTFCSLQGLSQQVFAEEITESIDQLHTMDLGEATKNEELWKRVQAAYTVSKGYINLNNGGVSPQPEIVQQAEKKYLGLINEMPSRYIGRVFPRNRSILRAKLAKLGGCQPEEVAMMYNTTEAINTVILGIDWKAGDEIVLSKHDYSTVKVGWEQLARRYQLKLVWVTLPAPIENQEEIIHRYISKFTSKTRLVHLTHIINWTGQIIPTAAIAKICTKARNQGIFSLVDGAHSLAHINFRIEDLNCDAYATSLHKWLCAPIGTGMLYLRRDQISKIWSMFPSDVKQTSSIEKFEHKGTISIAKEEAIHTAIEFHQHIGIELKEARLRFLKNYWAEQLREDERIQFYTSFDPQYAGAIALFDIKEGDSFKFSHRLEHNYRIHHTRSEVEGAKGVRISPNIYTSLDDLDHLVESIRTLLK